MAVLVLGASGLIGSAVVARLAGEGRQVIALGRSRRRGLGPGIAWRRLDLRRATMPADWTPMLDGVEAVVNCAGVLQDSLRDSTTAVHLSAPAALFAACEAAGVRRVIQVSALGADHGGVSAFSSTKHGAEGELMRRDLDWVILRPSVVVGRSAYGGSALFRGLAALPFAVTPKDAGLLQIVQLDELAQTVALMLQPSAPAKVALDVAGPERLSFEVVVASYRQWLGWPPAIRIGSASMLLALGYAAGDLAGLLGWRAPIRSTARKELVRGAVGDPGEWVRLTGIAPRSLAQALAAEPASVQERWFARLYLLKPVVFVVFAAFWLITGLISLSWGDAAAVGLMRRAGAGGLSEPAVVAGGLADLFVGAMIAWRPTARLGLYSALVVSLVYLVAASMLAPNLWADPLGALVKIAPILVLNLVALAILDDR